MIRGASRYNSVRCSAARSTAFTRMAKPLRQAVSDLGSQLAPAAAAAVLLLSSPGVAGAAEKVASFNASGFLFKDSVEVTSFDDPEVGGVTLYISDFKRSLAEKLQKDFFTEPSQASLTCAATGPIVVGDIKRIESTEGKEVFSEKKSLNLFQDKTLRVRRIYDKKQNALIYVAYSTRLSTAGDDGAVSTGRYRTSLCAIPLTPAPAPAPVAAPAAAAPAPAPAASAAAPAASAAAPAAPAAAAAAAALN